MLRAAAASRVVAARALRVVEAPKPSIPTPSSADSVAALELALELADAYLRDPHAAEAPKPKRKRGAPEISRYTGRPKRAIRIAPNRLGRIAFLKVQALALQLMDDYRQEHGHDYGALRHAAHELGVPDRQLCHVIHDGRYALSLLTVERIAKRTGISIRYLTDPKEREP